MFTVKTQLGNSKIHGIGVFAGEFIPKGTVVWEYHPGFDVTFTDEQLAGLPSPTQKEVLFRSWKDKTTGLWIYPVGNDGFVNHSEEPNLVSDAASWDSPSVAPRNISPGEELTEDYRTFDAAWEEKLLG